MTYRQIQAWHANLPDEAIPVVTGFIRRDRSRRDDHAGPRRQDYSAALFASALSASALERWTDVDGL